MSANLYGLPNEPRPQDNTMNTQYATPTPETPPRPWWKNPKVLSWIGLIFGVLGLLQVFTSSGARDAIGTVFIACVFLIPSLWWFHCERADHAAQQQYEESTQHWQYLTAQDKALLGDSPQPATKKQRKWPLVWALTVLVAMIGTAILPNSIAESRSEKATTSPKPTSEKPTKAPDDKTSETASESESEEEETAETEGTEEESTESEAEQENSEDSTSDTADEPSVEETIVVTVYETPTPRPAQTYQEIVQEQQVVEVHEGPQPDLSDQDTSATAGGYVHFSNCDEAWAAGAAPIASDEPGYRPGLDRDNDGWACEPDL